MSSAPYAVMRSRVAAGRRRARTTCASRGSRSPGSTASNSQWRSASGTPSRMQIACIGSSAATSTHEVERHAVSHRVEQRAGAAAQLVLERRIIRGVRPGAHQPADPRVARVVHHVEHHARRRAGPGERAAVGAVAAALGRVRGRSRAAPRASRRGSRPTRSPRRRACARSARATTPAPRAGGTANRSCGKPSAKLSRSVRSMPSIASITSGSSQDHVRRDTSDGPWCRCAVAESEPVRGDGHVEDFRRDCDDARISDAGLESSPRVSTYPFHNLAAARCAYGSPVSGCAIATSTSWKRRRIAFLS